MVGAREQSKGLDPGTIHLASRFSLRS
ncbi:hypothetical protein SBA1_820008 [Candidatus Sulfotelmatobacter kueseliae]|uniref:Uncharacterized protein n=1 Tax=Candidatus Sulfotelmatobacter kueseliae TaxID=2042962 RepID=A0A2U3L8K1_9BACT|nr:hypothetical protein SBA1_820008 [Candidatus Sulfotelmatobacter kueseliae]